MTHPLTLQCEHLPVELLTHLNPIDQQVILKRSSNQHVLHPLIDEADFLQIFAIQLMQ